MTVEHQDVATALDDDSRWRVLMASTPPDELLSVLDQLLDAALDEISSVMASLRPGSWEHGRRLALNRARRDCIDRRRVQVKDAESARHAAARAVEARKAAAEAAARRERETLVAMLVADYTGGMALQALAKKHQMREPRVRELLIEGGATIRPQGMHITPRRSAIDVDRVVRLARAGFDRDEITARLGASSWRQVYTALRAAGISSDALWPAAGRDRQQPQPQVTDVQLVLRLAKDGRDQGWVAQHLGVSRVALQRALWACDIDPDTVWPES